MVNGRARLLFNERFAVVKYYHGVNNFITTVCAETILELVGAQSNKSALDMSIGPLLCEFVRNLGDYVKYHDTLPQGREFTTEVSEGSESSSYKSYQVEYSAPCFKENGAVIEMMFSYELMRAPWPFTPMRYSGYLTVSLPKLQEHCSIVATLEVRRSVNGKEAPVFMTSCLVSNSTLSILLNNKMKKADTVERKPSSEMAE